MIFVQIPSEITQEQPQYFPFPIVIDFRIPLSVISFLSFMEILEVSAIPHIKPVIDVLACMSLQISQFDLRENPLYYIKNNLRVNNIHENLDAISMCLVN